MSSQTAQPTSTTPSPAHSAAHSAARATRERLTALITQPLADAQYELVDVVASALGTAQASVQVFVDNSLDHPLGGRIDLDGVSAATRIIDAVLEAADPIDGAFTLEVSSPGLERTLRTPAHFQRKIGKTVAIRLREVLEGARRVQGVLIAADDTTATVRLDDAALTERIVPLVIIDRARTVFAWAPAPKPGRAPAKKPGAPKAAGKGNGMTAAAGKPAPGPSDELDFPIAHEEATA